MARCRCGHEHFEACPNCLCSEPHDEVRMVEVLLNGRWPLALPSHRAYRREWTTPPYWEAPRLAAMHDVIAAQIDPVVVDVGAEEADFTGLFASWGAQVWLVEPNPKVWPNAKAIFEANDLVERVAGCFVGFCGETEDVVRPSWIAEHVAPLDGRWPACASGPVISDHGFCVIVERPDIPVTTVDRIATLHIPPTVITIDVEGAELTVLRGARRTLLDHRPAVFVSVHQDLVWMEEKFAGDTFDALDAYMREMGYEGTHLATDHEAHWQYLPVGSVAW